MRNYLWKYIVTLDEAWLYLFIFLFFSLSTDHESIWLSPKDEAPQGDTKGESSPKMILMFV
jgi:hypothetical protein